MEPDDPTVELLASGRKKPLTENSEPTFCTARKCDSCRHYPILDHMDSRVRSQFSTQGETCSPGTIDLAQAGVALVGGTDVLAVLERVLYDSGEFRFCGCFPTANQILQQFPTLDIKLILFDLHISDNCGIAVAHALRAQRPDIKLIFITSLRNTAIVSRIAATGASGILVRPFHARQCLATLRFAAAAARPSNRERRCGSLNTREDIILSCLAEGLLYKEIEDRLQITSALMKKLQKRIFKKLHARNRTEAVTAWKTLPNSHVRKQN